MAIAETLTGFKNRIKGCLLPVVFLLSFFALLGQVYSSVPNNRNIAVTEVLAFKPCLLNRGISYKRAAFSLNKIKASCLITRESCKYSMSLYHQLTQNRYMYLGHAFLVNKSSFNYPISHLHYAACKEEQHIS